MLATGLLAVLLPVAIRNQCVGGEFHLTTSQFGYNLYLGNNAETDGTFKPLRVGKADVRYEREDARSIAEQALGSTLTPAGVSHYWANETWDYIRSCPWDWLQLTVRKLALTFNATEIGDTEDLYTYAESSRLIRWLSVFLHMGVLCPIAIIGILISWKERRNLLLLYLMFAVYAASVVIFVIYGRYRFPLVPFLILFASEALVRCKRSLVAPGHRGHMTILLAIGVAVAVCTNWPILDKDSYRISTHANIANALIEEGEYDKAHSHLTTALRLAPTYHNAHYLMGVMLSRLDQLERAEWHYRQAIQYEPRCALQYAGLGALLSLQGNLKEGAEQFETSIKMDPTCSETYGNLSIVLAQLGRLEDALSVIEDGLRLDGESELLQFNYGLMLRHAGRLEESRRVFQQILQANPHHHNTRHNLVTIYLDLDQPRNAIEELDTILALDPQNIGTKVRLAWLLASHERDDIRSGSRALRLAVEICQAASGPDPCLLDLLAAAHAENGDFSQATHFAAQAVELAAALGDSVMASDIEHRRQLYAQGHPYHQPHAGQ